MAVLTTKEIMEIIPHRQPFLLVDTIEELEPGKRAVGKKCVSYNEPYFAGHFPGELIMPGVLIIEALAQVGAVIALSEPENKGKLATLVESAKPDSEESSARRCTDAGSGNFKPERAGGSGEGVRFCGGKSLRQQQS